MFVAAIVECSENLFLFMIDKSEHLGSPTSSFEPKASPLLSVQAFTS